MRFLPMAMPGDSTSSVDERVLIVAPTRRDAEVTSALLRAARVYCKHCADMRQLTGELPAGVGAVLITESSFADPTVAGFVSAMASQEPWSDVPVLVLTRGREDSPASVPVLAMLTNVTLLDRPVSTRSMVSAVLSALRARQRQYQMRDELVARRRAEQALRDADTRKDEFLATLSHELRNPLAPIRTGLQVLARLPDGHAKATQLREMMERQLDHLVKLVDDLLELSRITTGRLVLRRERIDMRTVAQAVLEASQPLLDEAGHQVLVELPSQAVWVRADPSRLAQVLGNLVNNAAKYTPPRGRITLSMEERDGQAVARVSDNGAGIPPEMTDAVFEMFTQVDRTLDRSRGGLGIGLSLVRRLMRMHGGTVEAESAGIDRGSTFTIRLPTVAPEAVESATAGARRGKGRRVRVLVVDDNVDAADSLSLQLEHNGHQTRTVYRGVDALPAAAEFAPDVVICDIGMPGMDGNEVASALRADPRSSATVLVALTGWGTEDDKRRTRRAGFDFHLIKPVSFETVDAVLAQL